MSYRLEYNWAAFRVPADKYGLSEDRFVVAIEGGDNNVRDGRTGKRARDWDVCMIGTATQVLKKAVYYAGACAGGSLQPHGRWCTPESYIRRIRRLLEQPPKQLAGWWEPLLRVSDQHPAVALASTHNLVLCPGSWYGHPQVRVSFDEAQLPLFFDFVDRYADLPPWRFAQVHGLPNS